MARPQTVSNEEILRATLDCLLERGSSVSMDVIAGKLGVSSQALLKRFHSKQELMIAALRPPDCCPWHEFVNAGPTEEPLSSQLMQIAEQLALFFVDIARRFSLFRFSGLDPRALLQTYDEPPPLADIRVLAAWFERAADRGLIRKCDYRATALMLMSALHTPAMLEDVMGFHPISDDREANLQSVIRLLIEGLRPDPTDSLQLNSQIAGTGEPG